MARGAPINRRTSTISVLRHMRRHPHRAQLIDKVFGVIGLVGSERDPAGPVGAGLDHMQRRHPLGMPIRLGQAGVDKQAMAVFHQSVPHEAELGLLALAFSVEPGVRVGRRGVRLVGAFLAMEVDLCVPSAASDRRRTRTTRLAIPRALFRLDGFHRRPGFDQRYAPSTPH